MMMIFYNNTTLSQLIPKVNDNHSLSTIPIKSYQKDLT